MQMHSSNSFKFDFLQIIGRKQIDSRFQKFESDSKGLIAIVSVSNLAQPYFKDNFFEGQDFFMCEPDRANIIFFE